LSPSSLRPPRALSPRKARHAAECIELEQLPNIGPSLATDLRDLGLAQPQQLRGQDALALYRRLCELRGRRQDPCVLDTFISAIEFMDGGEPRPWWQFTARRKALHGTV